MALLEIMRKLDIAMYTTEGRLNKQINNNTWNACLFCVSTILRAPTYVKSRDLTRLLTLGSLLMMSQPQNTSSHPEAQEQVSCTDTRTTHEIEGTAGDFRMGCRAQFHL